MTKKLSKSNKHPGGLYVLFFTEIFERLGFYLMLGIFTLYMIAPDGMNFGRENAHDIYGSYLALVYLTPFFGGLLADRLLGYRKSIIIGGVLMGIGYILLSQPTETMFFSGLLCIIIGNGFFKPNISAVVGRLYKDKSENMRSKGFSIFYIAINVGAFVSNFIAAYLRIKYGWGWAFAGAGIGMFIGITWFITAQGSFAKDIREADHIEKNQDNGLKLKEIFIKFFLPMIAAGIFGWFVPNLIFGSADNEFDIFGSHSNDAFVFAIIFIVLFFVKLVKKSPAKEKKPIKALLVIFSAVSLFWAVFHQNGAALNDIWAKNHTDREVPAYLNNTFSTLSLSKTISRNSDDAEYFEIPNKSWGGETNEVTVYTSEILQSINGGFIILFTPFIMLFFMLLRKRNKEPSIPSKIGIGMIITALSALVMVGAVIYTNNASVKASGLWLFGTYAVITVGELFLSPVGLNMVAKVAPKRINALMFGSWFLASAIGNKLSGVLSNLWEVFENKSYFFIVNIGLATTAVILIFALLPWLKSIIRGN